MLAVPQEATQQPHSMQRSSSKMALARSFSMRSSMAAGSNSWSEWIQDSILLLVERNQVPVSTERSPTSLNTGRGMRVISSGNSAVRVLQARPGRPLMTMPQEPQMAMRQAKSKIKEGSCSSRILLSAMNRVRLGVSSSTKVSVWGTDSGSSGLKRNMLNFSFLLMASPLSARPWE